MEITIKSGVAIDTLYNPRMLDYGDPKKIKIYTSGQYYHFYYDNHVGNCKVCVIQRLQNSLEDAPEKTITRLNELFKCVEKYCHI